MLIRVRWIPFLVGAGFLVSATEGRWMFSPRQTSPVLIALDVVLGIACLVWAWWIRKRRLARQALLAIRDEWAAYGQARYAEDHDSDPSSQATIGSTPKPSA